MARVILVALVACGLAFATFGGATAIAARPTDHPSLVNATAAAKAAIAGKATQLRAAADGLEPSANVVAQARNAASTENASAPADGLESAAEVTRSSATANSSLSPADAALAYVSALFSGDLGLYSQAACCPTTRQALAARDERHYTLTATPQIIVAPTVTDEGPIHVVVQVPTRDASAHAVIWEYQLLLAPKTNKVIHVVVYKHSAY
jgi:hypothetical protein